MRKCLSLFMAIMMVFVIVTIPAMAEKPLPVKLSINEALNVSGGNIEFITNDPYPWAVDSDNGWAHSTNQGQPSSTSTVSASVTAEEGDVVMFDYRVSCEARWDMLKFSIDGECVASSPWTLWSGDLDWTNTAFELTAGSHELRWEFIKDSSGNNFEDTAWLDNVYVGEPVHPESITSSEFETVSMGRMLQLGWTVLPENAYNKDVTFTSSNPEIAVVSQNGIVTGVAVGNADITITAVDGGVSTVCRVEVVEGIPPVQFYGYTGGSFVNFTDVNPAIVNPLAVDLTIAAAEFAGGTVYGYTTDKTYFIMDLNDLSYTTGANAGSFTIKDMAFDHSANKLYALASNSDGDTVLCNIERATGAISEIAAVRCGTENAMTLAISAEGIAYTLTESYSNGSKLYRIDLTTGEGSLIGTTGMGLKRAQSMGFDHNTNTLYWGRFSDYDASGLTIININTGAATDCGVIGNGGPVIGLFIPNNIPVEDGQIDDHTVTFIDGTNNEILSTITVENGHILTAEDFPNAPTHAGYTFIDWDYNGLGIFSDTSVTARYFDLSTSTITLIVDGEVMLDGSGFQMLLDDDANEYGYSIPTEGPFAYGAEGAVDRYANFEYKLPANADGSFDTDDDSIYADESYTAVIPAGVYDWVIVNPRIWDDDGPIIDIVNNIGTANGRNNDYTFEGGKHYIFTVYRYGELSAVDVEIIDYNPSTSLRGDIDGNGVVDTIDALLALRAGLGLITVENIEAADINGDGIITVIDAALIHRHVIGLIPEL